ncbi:MAG: hypothetical protein HYV33_06255 [Candidatus Kerfeldbacteria bacterium]|nr:hypothetical protein [Candidatus Kerfeldbacteria bacterium]
MLQIKKRKDTVQGWRFMCTICFYQDSRHDRSLYWIRQTLRCGYISKRKDNITELRINGYTQCYQVLIMLKPFIRFKSNQVRALLKAITCLKDKRVSELSKHEKLNVLSCITTIQKHNYQSSRKRSAKLLKKMLNLTP